jgi:hypothetical protein
LFPPFPSPDKHRRTKSESQEVVFVGSGQFVFLAAVEGKHCLSARRYGAPFLRQGRLRAPLQQQKKTGADFQAVPTGSFRSGKLGKELL